MTKSRKNVQRKVGDIMGGKVLEMDIIKAHREGIAEGITQGFAEGRTEGLEKSIKKLAEYYMSQDDSLTEEQAINIATKILR